MAALVVSDARDLEGNRCSVRAVDGVIAAMGSEVAGEADDDRLDADAMLLLPGLVNGHTHSAMTLFRGYGGDMPLMDWLEQMIWPAEARLRPDDVYWGTRLACLEMIRSGTTRFWDMYWHPEAAARAVHDAGIRAVIGGPIIDNLDADRGRAGRAALLDDVDAVAGVSARVDVAFAPHSMYTVSESTLEWVAGESADRGLPVQLHFLETEDEETGCLSRTGLRPGAFLDRIGLLSERLVLAHGVWMDPDTRALVGERRATVVTNPVSNLKLAVGGIFDFGAARGAGVSVGLGTDGASSNNSLDLLAELKTFALVQKHRSGNPAAAPAAEAWAVATGALAPALRGGADLAVGKPADFLLVRSAALELTPGHLLENLVYAASGSVVDTVVVDGAVVMRGGAVPEEEEVRARAIECARRLGVV